MPTLNDVLTNLALDLKVDPAEMIAYAEEDHVGGYHPTPWLAAWPMGSIFEVEGKVLYALTRALKPMLICEIGVYFGCSSTHILTALAKNKQGILHSFDIEGGAGHGPPQALRDRWVFQPIDANEGIPMLTGQYDLAFEDGYHEREGTEKNLKTIKKYLNPRVVVSHDADHPAVGQNVCEAYAAVFKKNWQHALIPPSDCGLAWHLRND